MKSLRERMAEAAEVEEFERAARYRDLISTVEQLQEKQRIATVEGDDADVFGFHYENQMLAVNLFHMRGGKVLDRREFFWEDLPEFGEYVEAIRALRGMVLFLLGSFIRENFFRHWLSSFIWGSLMYRAIFMCRWILRIARNWRKYLANS